MPGSTKVFKTLGSSNHTPDERAQFDYYATDPQAVEMLLALETFAPVIWEPACGEGHISNVLAAMGLAVLLLVLLIFALLFPYIYFFYIFIYFIL